MEAEKIIQDLNRRFAAPLPEFYKRRVIFWYDEDKEFEDRIDAISLERAKIVKLTGSNSFAIKKLLAVDDTTNNYLVYCPVSFERPEDNWLLNIELYSGEPFRADLNTIWMDEMGLPGSQIFRKQVKQYHKFFNSKERRAKVSAMAGSINTSAKMHLAVMAVICGVKDIRPNSIIRAILKGGMNTENNAAYRGIVSYGAQGAFWALIAQSTGYKNADEPSLARLATHIFLTAATRTLRREYLTGLDSFISTPHQSFCHDFVSDWLHSDDLQDLYKVARMVETEVRLYQRFGKLGVEDLWNTECFPCINEVILAKVMTEIKDGIIRIDVITQIVEKRRAMVWYDFMSDYYEGLLQIAKMQAFFLEHSAGFHIANAKDIWKEYTVDYYRMDSYYRVFHLCFGRSLKASNDLLDDLFKHVAEKVEALYSGWYLNGLGGNWSDVAAEDLEKHGYIEGVNRQAAFFGNNIRDCDTRVFVIISDALRYEVAASLAEQLRRETQSKVTLGSMCGIFPTITPYGMAALLPHKELSVQEKPNGGLAVLADGQSTESINRDKVLKAVNPASVALQYRNMIGLKRADRQALVKGMEVVYFYHDKIDEASHTSDSAVFPACEEAIEEIKNLVRIIVNEFGGTRILITADHGFLYTYSPLTEDDKVSKNSWNGKEVDYGRRYAIMGKDAKPEYLMPVKFLDGKTDYAAFAPREDIRIKMNGGGLNFVHGGISLQEMVVPLIDYHYLRNDSREYQMNRAKIDTKPVEVCLLSANRKIGNMIFSLNFYQKEAVGDNREKANYSLYFTDSAGKPVSDTARIIADKISENSQERTFRCTFNLKSLSFDNKETYYLVIEDESGLQMPQRVEFRIDIALAIDEFNFF
jgi:uncharacterized protein (TIGR02687 family)